MKKLIIAAAIVCSAALSQAAVANWQITCSNIYDGKGTSAAKLTSATAYIFDAGKTAQSSLFEAWATGTAISSLDGYITDKAISAGSIVSTSGANQFSYGLQSTDETKQYYDFYFAVIASDGKSIFISKLLEDQPANGNNNYKSLGFGTAAPATGSTSKSLPTAGFVAGGQWAQVAPEPTSGLLLLLGVAGLALRRRRA